MDSRLELQTYLETLCKNVYFQPPSEMRMAYPAICYSRSAIEYGRANNSKYLKNVKYDITVMDHNPDSLIAQEILKLNHAEYDRQFNVNGLNHIAITLYY